jgi:hypothetical protein
LVGLKVPTISGLKAAVNLTPFPVVPCSKADPTNARGGMGMEECLMRFIYYSSPSMKREDYPVE